MYLAFNKPSSTPSAINLTAFEISCLDVYAKQTFKVALEEVNTNKDKKLILVPVILLFYQKIVRYINVHINSLHNFF